MQTIELHDELTIERIGESQIKISTDRKDLSVGKDNLIHKAAKLLLDEYDLPGGISVQLKKNIPVAAGLAGGSTDAAATMIAVNELFGLGLSKDELMRRAVSIGADVPYCIMGGTALSEGIGEILTPIGPCPEWKVLIAKPPVSVSTAHVYQSFRPEIVKHPDIDMIAEGIGRGDFHKVVTCMGNVLESVTMSEVPYIGEIKNIMADHGYPLMSGSGPTVFGLFETDDAVNRAYEDLKNMDHVEDLVITRIYDPNTQVD